MDLHYEPVRPDELLDIMKIENAGFSPAEAATTDAMQERISAYPDTFIVAKNDAGKILGYVVGPAFNHRYLTDELYAHAHPNNPDDKYQAVLSLAVHPDFQHSGIGSRLLTELSHVAKRQERAVITLTCLQNLVPFYEHNGYRNEGVSNSSHADETWFNMVLPLE